MFLKGETMDLGGVPGRLATRCWQAGYGVAGRPGMNVPHSMDLYGGGGGADRPGKYPGSGSALYN